MRLARLELKDVGPFEDAVFEIPEPKGPGELVLFEGPNGSGKTTIVQVIACAVAPKILIANPLESPDNELTRRILSTTARAEVRLGHGAESVAIALVSSSVPGAVVAQASSGGAREIVELIERLGAAAVGMGTVTWAAFAFKGHMRTPVIATEGPNDIKVSPLRGALSFGEVERANSYFGQFLTNVEFDRIKAALYAQEAEPSEERDEMAVVARARKESLRRFEAVFSRVIDRGVRIQFPFGQHSPDIMIDGEKIPIDLLGEGMRSTIAWLADLLVRLERIPWADTTRSPLEQDFWLILDEIDESLHPTMQARILPAIRELFPNARIYATTHSPFVVASVGEGTIFPIRPGKDHKVRGQVEARALQYGQSLELVTADIFQAPSGFVDQRTQDDLKAHDRDVQALQRKKEIDWDAFLARRDRLWALNEEVRVVVGMQEARVREEIARQLRERAEAGAGEARP